MSFGMGTKTLLAFCKSQNAQLWQKSKLGPELFKDHELEVYKWVSQFIAAHHALPQASTLEDKFPALMGMEVIEPPTYYLQNLENAYLYNLINQANLDSQNVLLQDKTDHAGAAKVLQEALHKLTMQKFRQQVLNVGKDGGKLVLKAYHDVNLLESKGLFGWPYMDYQSGGLLPGDIISFCGRPAAGKAQPLTEPVLTASGYKLMGDVQVGDHLASVDGAPSVVQGVFPQGLKAVYKLKFQDGRSTEASAEHLWEVLYREWDAPKVKTTLQLIAMLEKKRYKNRLSVRLFTGEFGYLLKEPFSPYMLGCLIGDGCFRHTGGMVGFTTADSFIFNKLAFELRMSGLNLIHRSAYDYVITDERMQGNRMRDWIVSLGLQGTKSEHKTIPEKYMTADRKTRLELIQGLMDTDGCAEKKGGVTYSTSSPLLAQQVVDLIRSLGGKASISEKETSCLLHYRISIVHGNRSELFTLPRKVGRVLAPRTTHTNHRLTLSSIEPVGQKECQCLMVSHPSHLYVTSGYTVTHNTWLTLYTALKNWMDGQNVLFVSMEMGVLPISQRVTSMYTHCNVSQLKTGAFSKLTYDKFNLKLKDMEKQPGQFYVVSGNLAANMEDIYSLASQLQCLVVIIDGAYLVRHKNAKLDRFNRVAENCELMKQYNEALGATTFASWQFNRDAVKNSKKSGKQETNLEDIGYSDAIGQISSIVCGLFQEDSSIEAMLSRKIRLMKGRNGEIGEFSINWEFGSMNFDQCDPPIYQGNTTEGEVPLKWL
jgi:replicative DNA helicase